LGGTDDDSNMITLTAREHFLAHYCLWKFSEGQSKSKMARAFSFMRASNNDGRYVNSRLYSSLRNTMKHTEESKRKISDNNVGMIGKTQSTESRRKISEARKGTTLPESVKQKISKKLIGIKLTDEHKRNIGSATSKALKGKPWSAKRRAALKSTT
jgi:hypothetical protein